jgi:hypothetical protein
MDFTLVVVFDAKGFFHAMQCNICQKWAYHPSYNSAKKALEFTVAIPRATLRARYGDGFAGAPIEQRCITRARRSHE